MIVGPSLQRGWKDEHAHQDRPAKHFLVYLSRGHTADFKQAESNQFSYFTRSEEFRRSDRLL